ncbi:hypothetical protein CBL21_26485 [Shigella flexneri]|nr:hypothetical protein CBL21_26485 [Shigella flexneri]
MTDFGGKTSIFSHPVYLFLRKFSLQDSRGGSINVFVITKLSESLIFTLSYKINKMQPNSKPHIFSVKVMTPTY